MPPSLDSGKRHRARASRYRFCPPSAVDHIAQRRPLQSRQLVEKYRPVEAGLQAYRHQRCSLSVELQAEHQR